MFNRFLLLVALTVVPQAPAFAADATILCYHVVETPSDTHFTLSRETFDRQMAYLASAGYNVIPLSHLAEYLAGTRASIPPNAVVLTIDDGWLSTYTEFWPIARKYGFTFTAFIYPKFVGQSRFALSWEQIREMADAGVEIESHAYSHPFLARSRNRFSSSHYAQWLAAELINSKRAIEEKTGKPVRVLAYPYGDFDSTVVTQTRAAGYDAAVTASYGTVRQGQDRYRLSRVVIEKSTSFAQFRRYLGAAPLPLDDISPRPGHSIDPGDPVIEARIRNPERIAPGSLSAALLGSGRIPFTFDPSTGVISTVLRDTPSGGRWHDVVIWARERGTGRRLEASWRVKFPEPDTQPVVVDSADRPEPGTLGMERE